MQIKIIWEVLARVSREEKETNGIVNGKEKAKMFMFVDDVICILEVLKTPPKTC